MNTVSPWLEETQSLGIVRNYPKIQKDISTDVLIVGGGIAGISTAYFLLTKTNKNVVLIEGNKIVSGATGHNAGYVGGGFEERDLKGLIDEFGEEIAVQGFKDLEASWNLIHEMAETALIPDYIFMQQGATGEMSLETTFSVIESNMLKKKYGLYSSKIYIAHEALEGIQVPQEYEGEYELVCQEELLSKIRSKDNGFIALYQSNHIASMNSAKFCTYILNYLVETYSNRINVFEHSFIEKIVIDKDTAASQSNGYIINTNEIVLCTNAYTNFKVEDKQTGKEYTKLKDSIEPLIQYMVGFKDNDTDFYSGSYHEENHAPEAPYYYLSKRPFMNKRLTAIGGEDRTPNKNEVYNQNEQVPQRALDGYKKFVDRMWGLQKDAFDYKWLGLLGYTPNRTRWIGRDDIYSRLIYNLGCNGIGILHSIHGGYKVADIVNEKEFNKSIFDI